MKTTRVEPFTVLEGDASGELAGKGIWHLSTEGSDTIARYDWQVDATQAWMKLMAPVARPFFAWNHDIIMRWGAPRAGTEAWREGAGTANALMRGAKLRAMKTPDRSRGQITFLVDLYYDDFASTWVHPIVTPYLSVRSP